MYATLRHLTSDLASLKALEAAKDDRCIERVPSRGMDLPQNESLPLGDPRIVSYAMSREEGPTVSCAKGRYRATLPG